MRRSSKLLVLLPLSFIVLLLMHQTHLTVDAAKTGDAAQECSDPGTCSNPDVAKEVTTKEKNGFDMSEYEKCRVRPTDSIYCSDEENEYIARFRSTDSTDGKVKEAKDELDTLLAIKAKDEEFGNFKNRMPKEEKDWLEKRLHILKRIVYLNDMEELRSKGDKILGLRGEGEFDLRFGPEGDRLITLSELSQYLGKGGASPSNPLWISVLGEVFDVTEGESYYGFGKGGYSMFAGKDASACFSTGKFNEDGASQKLSTLKPEELAGILGWKDFYHKHKAYKYLGLFVGATGSGEVLFSDGSGGVDGSEGGNALKMGEETNLRKYVVRMAAEIVVKNEKEQERKRIEREERLKKKKK